jgi:hypothetical protein
MPKYNNHFSSPDHMEETILNAKGEVVGTIRVKPSSVLWKPKGAQKYYSVSLDSFTTWISDPGTKARKVGS